ncbi:PAS domain-containing protein [Sphingomonas sp. KC8]|uniref:PAS domain-containing protein n=1 Tax=Sphingomonas sp. KC8 TaxID=1030157 RepID=UPI000248BEBA|nr:PAS domain-containing protein [Sphingomonas sp. KC8]ARS26346.1 signal transduction histidine kinase [Sphingomonas sp. KC8]
MGYSTERLSVTSAELVRQFGRWQDKVATEPLFVTHHGRERLVMLSMANYRSLLEGDIDSGLSSDGEQRLDVLADLVTQGFIAFDETLTIVRMNPVAACYLRGHRHGLIGRRLDEVYPTVANSLLENYLVRAVRSGETGAFDAPSFAQSGDWLHLQTFPFGNGAAVLFRSMGDEVEARRQSTAASAMAAAAAVHGGIGHGWLSPRGTFANVDAVLAGMAGFEAVALGGVRLTDILPLKRRMEAAERMEAVLAGNGPCAFDSEILVNRGDELPVRIGLADLRGDYANDGAVVVVTRR